MGLKKDLIRLIKGKQGDVFTYKELEQACKIRGRKASNGERRLRPSETDEIDTVRNQKNFIIGYRMKQAQGRLF